MRITNLIRQAVSPATLLILDEGVKGGGGHGCKRRKKHRCKHQGNEGGPEKIPGGLSSGRPDSEFDPEQLAAGIEVEMEHTTDPAIAKEIAKDHLTENPRYYIELKKIEANTIRGLIRSAYYVY